MNVLVWPIGAAIICVPLGVGLMTLAQHPEAVRSIFEPGERACPEKLGWMDQSQLTDDDWRRIRVISGTGDETAVGVIRSIQGGGQSSLSCRDFELFRQDRRRARAAYPDIKPDELFEPMWVQIDLSARIPESYHLSFNASGTTVDGKDYYDGPVYVNRVSPKYPNRARVEDTTSYWRAFAR